MEEIIRNILATNDIPVKVGIVYGIQRESSNYDICQATFLGASEKSEYYLKFDIQTKEKIVFHKNIRKKSRGDRKQIKNQFWDKWKPSQFCFFEDEEKVKFELMKDLDLVINNFSGKLPEINWPKITNIGKSPFERET